MSDVRSICILGFGEVGQILADDLSRVPGISLQTFDPLFDDESSIPRRGLESRPQVTAGATPKDAVAGSDLVISVVTAGEAAAAAESIAGALPHQSYYLDLNSVSPQTRRHTAEVIDRAGGCFVEGAVMAPIAPRRIESPILLGGPNAAEFVQVAAALGFTGAVGYSTEIGTASAVKMCRSVVIKGMEALLTEALAAARHYGVESTVLDSLGNLLPVEDWPEKARYMISRSLQHGVRRAEEMREVAITVAGAGLVPHMSAATVERQDWAARFADAVDATLTDMLDALSGMTDGGTREGGSDG